MYIRQNLYKKKIHYNTSEGPYRLPIVLRLDT